MPKPFVPDEIEFDDNRPRPVRVVIKWHPTIVQAAWLLKWTLIAAWAIIAILFLLFLANLIIGLVLLRR